MTFLPLPLHWCARDWGHNTETQCGGGGRCSTPMTPIHPPQHANHLDTRVMGGTTLGA